MKNFLKSAASLAATLAVSTSANAFTIFADIHAFQGDWPYFSDQYDGFGLNISADLPDTLWLDQIDVEVLRYDNKDRDDYDISSNQLTFHFEVPVYSLETAGFVGVWTDEGYEGVSSDVYYFGGFSALLVSGTNFDLQGQAGVLKHQSGEYPSANPNLGFATLTARYQASEAVSLYSKVSIYNSFGGFGDDLDERLKTRAATLGVNVEVNEMFQVFAEYSAQAGGWNETSDYDTTSLSAGVKIALGAASAVGRPKWEPIDLTPISWVRLDGW